MPARDTLAALCGLWAIPLDTPARPIEIPNVGRHDLARAFGALGFRTVVEVGVERGVYAQVICESAPDVQHIGVDPWQRYGAYRDHVGQAKLDAFYLEATARLAPYRSTLVRGFSVDVAREFDDGSVDAVYIDGNHDLAHVVADLSAWAPKVRSGGLICGHDWIRRRAAIPHHVVQATVAYTQCYRIDPWFVLGRKARRPGETRDTSRSFFWVQP